MATLPEISDAVRRAAAALLQQEGRQLPHGQAFELQDDDLQTLKERGFLRRGISGWEVDGEVAAALGLTEFDYS